MYDSKRLSSRLAEVADVTKATSLATLVVMLVAFLLKVRMINPGFVAIFWLFATTSAAGSRLVFRMWLRHIRKQGRNSRNLLIVGTNRRAIEFAKTIQSQPELGYKSIGFSDENWVGSRELSAHGFPVLCDLATLPAFLRRNVVDELVLALPFRSFHSYVSEIAVMCEQHLKILAKTVPAVLKGSEAA